VKFDETGQNILVDAIVIQYQGGKPSTVWPFNLAAKEMIYPSPSGRPESNDSFSLIPLPPPAREGEATKVLKKTPSLHGGGGAGVLTILERDLHVQFRIILQTIISGC